MFIKIRRGWEIPESAATPEGVYLRRRQFLAAAGLGAAAPSGARQRRTSRRSGRSFGRPLSGEAQRDLQARPRHHAGSRSRPTTTTTMSSTAARTWSISHRRCPFGPGPSPSTAWWRSRRPSTSTRCEADAAGRAALSPSLRRGLVDGGAVERLCAEEPGRSRRALARAPSTSASRPSTIPTWRPGLSQSWYPWPYIEGLTMAEATNELAFMVDRHVRQAGAEAERRAAASGDAVEVRIQIGEGHREDQLHRRAAEEFLGAAPGQRIRLLGQREPGGRRIRAGARPTSGRWARDGTVPTQLFNGYGAYVAGLYSGMQDLGDKLYR